MLFFSYAEVRAERRRAFGFEELSPPEIAPSSVKVRLQKLCDVYKVSLLVSFESDPDVEHYPLFQAQELYLDICSTLEPPRDRNSGARSVSSHSSRKSSHTALSDSACESSSAPESANSLNSRSMCTEILHQYGCQSCCAIYRKKNGIFSVFSVTHAAKNVCPAVNNCSNSTQALLDQNNGDGKSLFIKYKTDLR